LITFSNQKISKLFQQIHNFECTAATNEAYKEQDGQEDSIDGSGEAEVPEFDSEEEEVSGSEADIQDSQKNNKFLTEADNSLNFYACEDW